MSTENIETYVPNSYSKYNRIRAKLLLFIDSEIQSKIKHQKLKFNCEDEIKISFEETFIQKQIDKYDFSSSKILKTKIDNSNKTISTNVESSKKITEKPHHKKRSNVHSKTFTKEGNHPNKLLNDTIRFNQKFYSIKNVTKQSSTFLILPKQKNATRYLKTLCNNLKIRSKNKSHAKHYRPLSISTKFFDFSKDKKDNRKSNEIKMHRSKKDNLYTFSLFRKSQKGNFITNPKPRRYGKSSNLILIIN